MTLEEALEISKKSRGKIDILEIAGIKIRTDYMQEECYKQKVENMPKGKYYISDVDGTFFRGVLIKEAFVLFGKYIKGLDLAVIDLTRFNNFIIDYQFFLNLEKEAYNKKIAYDDYLAAGMFIMYKYHDLGGWDKFLIYLKEKFFRHEKVHPFRFSIKKLKEVLLSGDSFLFVSGASNFVLSIYIELLKEYIGKELGKEYVKNIYYFSSYANIKEKYVFNMWKNNAKFNFIKLLKENDKFEDIIGGMGDTSSDYGISNHLSAGKDFYFISPVNSVIDNHEKLKKKDVNYHFIIERKDLIFEFDPKNIKVIEKT